VFLRRLAEAQAVATVAIAITLRELVGEVRRVAEMLERSTTLM
jgi:hypothetical protein